MDSPDEIMKIVPPLTTCLLSALPDDTRIVLYRGEVAFAGVAERDPQRTRWIVVRDDQQFVRLLRQDEEVTAVVGPYILEPNISSLRPDRLGPAANMQLFLVGSNPCVVLHLGSAPGWRIFNLATGVSTSAAETDASSFSKWQVGVPDATGGTPHWLLKVL